MRFIFSIILSLTLFVNSAFALLPFNGKRFIEKGDGNVSMPDNSAGENVAGILIGNGLSAKGLIEALDAPLSKGLTEILILLYQIGDVVAVIILCYIGIKILLCSPQQKAQLKQSLSPYFIGLLLYIAGVPIAVFIINIFIKLF